MISSMPTPALLLLMATLLPLLGFLILLFVGKRMATPLAGWVGTAYIAFSFVCSIAAMMSWYNGGTYQNEKWGFEKAPINIPYAWVPVGQGINQTHPGFLDIGIYVDS